MMSTRHGNGGGPPADSPGTQHGTQHETGAYGHIRRRPGGLVRLLGDVAGATASLVALLLTALLLGAYLPGIPGVGVMGAVLGGQ